MQSPHHPSPYGMPQKQYRCDTGNHYVPEDQHVAIMTPLGVPVYSGCYTCLLNLVAQGPTPTNDVERAMTRQALHLARAVITQPADRHEIEAAVEAIDVALKDT